MGKIILTAGVAAGLIAGGVGSLFALVLSHALTNGLGSGPIDVSVAI